MKSFKIIIVCAAVLMPAQSAWSYQVTGPVLETTATKIVVQKGKDKWELARTADTKASAEVKVGDKVLYGKYAGTEITHTGKEYLIMRESDIFAIL